jgi:hypothetical protein
MCEECEQDEPLVAIYLRKANRHGWRPPLATTAPRYEDDATRQPAPMEFTCVDVRDTRID